jgi:hypothetical protein
LDEIDSGNEQAEKWLEGHIRAARGVVVDINGTGSCLHCGEKVLERGGVVSRFCDKECAAEWEHRSSLLRY